MVHEKQREINLGGLKSYILRTCNYVWFQTPIAINQSPVIREKAILLVKLMQHVEKRFPEEQELNAQFLELVNYIYR